jgi:tRNA-splicing ligase RtcB
MGNASAAGGRAPIHTFYSTRSWIEGIATKQLEDVASLSGIKAVAGMPDLHPGKYGPVGCSILADRIHPQLVGSDIGCGMGLFQLDLAVRKLRVDKAASRLRALDMPWEGDVAGAVAEAGLAPTPFDVSLGTRVRDLTLRGPCERGTYLRRPTGVGWIGVPSATSGSRVSSIACSSQKWFPPPMRCANPFRAFGWALRWSANR